MKVNALADEWDVAQDERGFTWKRLRAAKRLGLEALGASVFELPPGQRSFPYHFHHGNEELLLVLEGEAVVRTPAGEETVQPGDMIAFPRGPGGSHQVINRSDEPVRFAVISTMIEPDIAEYPDSGKVGLFAGAAPGGAPPDGALKLFLPRQPEVDYLDGEPRQ